MHGAAYLEDMIHQVLLGLRSRNRERVLASDETLVSKSCDPKFERVLQGCVERALAEYSLQSTVLLDKSSLNFQTNDYLFLGRSEVLNKAAVELASFVPVGSGSSRLLAGDHWIFRSLEDAFCKISGFESCLYVNSGTTANHILPQVLAFPDVAYFSDSANHASLIDGMRMAKIPKERRFIFPHGDYDTLETQLRSSDAACQIIFCEALYSMDGDQADLITLQALAARYRGVLVVDEAHSTGVYGAHGEGCVPAAGLVKENVIGVYTCGKSLATQGAFLAGPDWLRKLIVNRGRSFIFTTAPSPLIAAVTLVSLYVSAALIAQREGLSKTSALLRTIIQSHGYGIGRSSSHIVPLIVGRDHAALELARLLRERGIIASAIRPPTVPEGQSLVRLSLHAGLTPAHIERFVEALPLRKNEQ